MRTLRVALLSCIALLAACGGGGKNATTPSEEDGLPKPAVAGRSVTGMPDPGTPNARPAATTAQAPDVIEVPEPSAEGEIATGDPGMPAPPIVGAPETTMPTDPAAPPTTPAEEAASQSQDVPLQ